MQTACVKSIFIKFSFSLSLVILLMTGASVQAELPPYRLSCQFDSDAHFVVVYKKFYSSEYYEAGYTYRNTQAGSPDICDLVSNKNGIVHLLCEDQNIDRTYDLKFPHSIAADFFEVQVQDHRSKRTEIFKLCRMI